MKLYEIKREQAPSPDITDLGMKLVKAWVDTRTQEIDKLSATWRTLLVQGTILWLGGTVLWAGGMLLKNTPLSLLGVGVILLSVVWYVRQDKTETKLDRAIGTLKGASEVLGLQAKALLSETKSIRNDIKAKKEAE